MFSVNGLTGQTISGVINQYSKVSGQSSCQNSLIVSNPEYFSIEEDVIIIQMQGAVIDEADNNSFGVVSNYNGAGSYEKGIIINIEDDTIFFKNNFENTYDFTGKVQMVTFPNYQNVTITGVVTALPWDGEVGGVCAFQVLETLTMDAEINVDGLGFRGGEKMEVSGNSCSWLFESSSYFYPNTSNESTSKGEGISALIKSKEFGKGAQANGGGGGNDHNSGGGGGANYGSGGIGGRNNDPGLFNCQGVHPGIGGKSIDYTSTRAVLGGGGGAGHGNNGLSTGGANGGGIVIISGGYLEGSNKSITSNGLNANTTTGGDGAGGGGAGGSVILNIITYGVDLSISTQGGSGGDSYNEAYTRCFGPGGGGAGGLIHGYNNFSSVTTNVLGGTPGVVTGSTSGCNGSTNSATAGGAGNTLTNLSIPFGKGAPDCLTVGGREVGLAGLKVYPNPSNSFFTIENQKSRSQIIELIDSKGALIKVFEITNTLKIGETLVPGVYFIRLKNHKSVQHKKLIKL